MLKDLKIKTKIFGLTLLMMFALTIIGAISIYNEINTNNEDVASLDEIIRKKYDDNIRNQVETVITLLEGINKKYESEEITLEEAKELGTDLVRNLRYEKAGYFWIDTIDGTNIVILGNETEGTNRYNLKDIKGNLFIQEIIKNGMKEGGGYTNYWFNKAGEVEILPKRSYSLLFKPFNWVIGTGNYTDDIDQIISREKEIKNQELKKNIYVFVTILLVSIILITIPTYLILKDMVSMLLKTVQYSKLISEGDLEVKIPEEYGNRKDEIGTLINAFQKMQKSIKELIKNVNDKAEVIQNNEIRNRALLKANPDMMFVIDNYGKIVDFKDDELEQLYVRPEAFLGKKVNEVLPDYVAKKTMGNIYRLIETQEMQLYTYSLDINGKQDYEVRLLPYGDKLYLAIVRNITERKKLEAAIYKEKELLHTTLISVGDGVISTDKNGKIVLINKIAENLTRYTKEEAIGKKSEEVFNIINGITREKYKNMIEEVLKTGEILEMPDDIILISKDGTEIYIDDSVAPIRDKEGKINGTVLVFRDITEKKKKQKEIEYLSFHDALTGLYNRRFFEEKIIELDIKNEYPLSIIMADVNALKLTNDAFGHLIGDEVLKKVAEVIKNQIRADDIVARIGGDEIVILSTRNNISEVEEFINNLRDKFLSEKVGILNVSVSFGYSIKNSPYQKIEELFKRAEDHMYKIKLIESPIAKENIVNTIIDFFNEKFKVEREHSKRVSDICASVGQELGLSEKVIEELREAALLHDIGKVIFSDKITGKVSEFGNLKMKEIKRHPEIVYQILKYKSNMGKIGEYVLYHHEYWDGSGYPKGLKGEEIPIQARIISVIDEYDNLINGTRYRSAISKEEAINEIKKNSGTKFDPFIVNKIKILRE